MVTSKTPKVSQFFEFSSALKAEADKFKKLVTEARRILISSTSTSDGDSIGAQLGLFYLIRSLRGSSDEIAIVDHSPVPHRYAFLKGCDKIFSVAEWQAKPALSFDVGITCDGGVERTGDVAEFFKSIPHTILVDHHAVGSKLSYSSSILDGEASSTCELVYLLFEYFGLEIDRAIAEALYVGIVFDTGFFKHSLTTPRTHWVAAKLVETGIDFSKISDRALLERTWEAQLLLMTMLDNIERRSNGKLVSSHWAANELAKINPRDGDQEGMINQLYYTEGAEVIALFTERHQGEIKISFRSKGKVNVADFARSLNPEGGGHIRAAGCSMSGTLQEVKEVVLKKLEAIV